MKIHRSTYKYLGTCTPSLKLDACVAQTPIMATLYDRQRTVHLIVEDDTGECQYQGSQ